MSKASKAAAELGKLGGKARASALSSSQRSKIAHKAAKARWKKKGRIKNPVVRN